jgi:AraC-like DNA-binding protein
MMQYTEQRPSPSLAEHLECFWFLSDTDSSAAIGTSERVLPDGCVEWIFHLGTPFQRRINTTSNIGEWERQPRSFIVGELTRSILLQPAGDVAVMGVRFRPGGAYRFLPFSLRDFTDCTVPTGDVWGREGNYLEEAVLEARHNMQRQQLVEDFLYRQLVTTNPRPRFDAAVREIIRTRGQTRVREVANGVGWSSRQLERDFGASLGLSPKSFSRIMRFQNLLLLVGEGALREWANLAIEGGYADQPHMVREFREFTGHTPTEQGTAPGEFNSNFVSPQRLAALLGPS